MAHETDGRDRTWDCKEVDWDEYESHRPPYPAKLYELLFKHHKDHGGHFNVALDVGAGGGTVAKILLKQFHHVIWSDQSAEYIVRAQQRFLNEANSGSMTFLQKRFDGFRPETDFPKGQLVDMITAGTCIHFADPAHIMAQLGSLLQSGGTVAAFSYGSMPILPPGDPAGPSVQKCKDKMFRWIDKKVASLNDAEGPGTCQARYDNIEFDCTVWENVRRITSLPGEHVWPQWIRPAASRIRETESRELVPDDFISKDVDYEFFPRYFHNFAPQLQLLDQIKEELHELKVAFGDRTVTVRWPVIVALATKR